MGRPRAATSWSVPPASLPPRFSICPNAFQELEIGNEGPLKSGTVQNEVLVQEGVAFDAHRGLIFAFRGAKDNGLLSPTKHLI
jgi:hypothetical protein